MKENGENTGTERGVNTTFDENKVSKMKYEIFQNLLNPECNIEEFEYAWDLLPLY